MARLRYNTVEFGYISTKDVIYKDVYTTDNQDYLYTEIVLDVTGYVFTGTRPNLPGDPNPDPNAPPDPGVPPGFVGKSAPGLLKDAQHLLEQPRKKLEFQIGATKLIDADDKTYCKNGPFPEVLSLTQIDGIDALRIAFRVTTYVNKCINNSDPNFKPSPIISHRWREQETHGQDLRARRTRTGKLVIRGGRDHEAADNFRSDVTPGIPKGFVRERATYIVAEDGLSLAYVFEDIQPYKTPPFPASTMEGSFTEVNHYPGALRFGQFSMRLGASPNAPQSILLLAGLEICYRMLEAHGLHRDKDGKSAVEFTLSAKFHENSIEVTARAQLKSPKNNQANIDKLRAIRQSLGIADASKLTPKINLTAFDIQQWTQITPTFTIRTLPGLKLVAAALNDPCLATVVDATLKQQVISANAVSFSGAGVPGATDGSLPGNLYLTVVPTVPDLGDILSSSNYPEGGPYSYYDVRPRFVTNQMQCELAPMTADPTVPVAYVPLAGQTCRLNLEWVAERIGTPPVIPDVNLVCAAGAVLLDADESPCQIERLPGGAMRYRVTGCYNYGFQYPALVRKVAAVPPWVSDLQAIDADLLTSISTLFSNTSTSILTVGDQSVLSSGVPPLLPNP